MKTTIKQLLPWLQHNQNVKTKVFILVTYLNLAFMLACKQTDFHTKSLCIPQGTIWSVVVECTLVLLTFTLSHGI